MSSTGVLIRQHYGKERVRVMRVVRHVSGLHAIYEATASILLQGEFFDAYLSDDNHQVIPTDTMKNTVYALAREHLTNVPEHFALALADHFLAKYAHVSRVEVSLQVAPWARHVADGREHPHVFIGGAGQPFTRVAMSRSEMALSSGIKDVLLLKSAGSAFRGFPRDEFTTLPETDDRILSTNMEASWVFAQRESDFTETNSAVLSALLKTFADEVSPSVQNTLYLMGQAALSAAPAITAISITMPNKHYLPINLQQFGMGNDNDVFVPTDEPHGQIEALIGRST